MRNACRKEGLEIVNGHNIRLNNVRTGCSGFIKDPATGLLVYFNAEADTCCGTICGGRYYYRTAYGEDDYTGGGNNFCDDLEGIIEGAKWLFKRAHGMKAGMRWGYQWSDKAILTRDIP